MRILFVACCLLGLCACTNTAKLICRNWVVTDVQFTPTGTLNGPEKSSLRYTLTRDFQFHFNMDSTFYVVQNRDTNPGTWWLSEDKKTMFTATNQDTSSATIMELSKKVFAIKPLNTVNNIEKLVCTPTPTK